MARLPQPGGDNGNWGDILNEYLSQALKSDGKIKDNAVTADAIAPNSITNAAIATDAVNAASIADGSITNTLLADDTVQEAKLSSAVRTKLNSGTNSPDWNTITNKPAVIAAGTDQAAARAAIGAGVSNLVLGTTSTTAKAGDYTPTKTDVGLGSVDNTSDATKNSATATLTNKTISGSSNTLSNIPESAITNLTSDLAAKATDANVVHKTGNETITGNKSFTGSADFGQISYFKEVVIEPTNPGDTAALQLDNDNGQVWLNGNNSGGTFAIVDQTNNSTPFYIQPNSPDQSFTITSGGLNANQQLNMNGNTILNATFDSTNDVTFDDTGFTLQDDVDFTKKMKFELSGLTTNTTRTLTIPDANTTVVGTDTTQTLTNKTLTTPKVDQIKDSFGVPIIDLQGNATSTNFMQVGNSNGSSPWLEAKGTSADIGIELTPKGAGQVSVWTYSGNTPTITADGADADLDLNLKAKGTGKVKASGVDVVTVSATQTLTNKTFTNPDIGTATGSASLNVLKSGDTMSGALLISTSTDNSSGNQFVLNNSNTAGRGDIAFNENGVIKGVLQYRGTTNPAFPNTFRFISQTGTNADFVLGVNGTSSNLFIAGGQNGLTAGNIGVGTNTPSVKLDVAGEIRASTAGANSNSVVTVGGAQTLTSKTLTAPVINNLPTGTGVASAATAATLAARDASANLNANMFVPNTASTATAAATTTLTIASAPVQIFTGTTTQTVLLPTTSVVAGQTYTIINQSSGSITVQSSGGNTVFILTSGRTGVLTANFMTPTAATHWVGTITNAGKSLSVSNSLILAGTDSSTMTFPNTSATIARTDAAQTFTGTQTFSSGPSFGALPVGAGVSSAATASTLAARDANANLTANTLIPGTASTVTAAATTTLTIASAQTQVFTGTTTQTVLLPSTSVAAGQTYFILNQSSGVVTVQSSSANTISTLAANRVGIFTADIVTPTTAAHWVGNIVAAGKALSASNSLTLAGTDATTMTFPTTNATIARTDAAQTFTGTQTFSSGPSFGALPGGAGVASAATASTLAARDANTNLLAGNFINGFATTVTAAGTTPLTITSKGIQVFTGTTTQTVTLPTTSVIAGGQYMIINQSTGAVAVQSSGANTVTTLNGGTSAILTALVATPTTAANWNAQVIGTTTQPRVTTITSSATPAINTDVTDLATITAQAVAITSMSSSLTGNPANGQKLMVRIKDNGSPQSIVWGASFVSSGIATLLSATVAGKAHHVGLTYDSVAAKWVCIAVDATGY